MTYDLLIDISEVKIFVSGELTWVSMHPNENDFSCKAKLGLTFVEIVVFRILVKSFIVNVIFPFLWFYYQDRIILGSDYPFPLGEHHPGKLVESMDDLSPKLKVIFLYFLHY